MTKTELKPEIRFAGFADAWVQRKLGNHAEILTGGTPSTSVSKYWEPKEIPWLSSGEVNKRRIDSADNMISREGFDNSSAQWVKKNSVLIALAGQGKTRGTVAINRVSLTTNQSIAAIVPDNTIHYEFIFQNLFRRYDELRMMSSGDGTRGGLNKQLISDVLIICPSIEEQAQIGQLFAALDHLITLHQREYNKTANIKKAMLEKMFPKNGADKPEIRFAGFTDAWEQRKAIELFETTADKNHLDLPVLSATQEFGMIKRDDTGINIAHDISNEATYKRVLPGQFVIHLRSFQGGFAHSALEGITSPAYTVFGFKDTEKHSDDFWKYIFNSEEFIRRLETVTYGIRDGRSISFADFLTMSFCFPTVAEQVAIADFFCQVDRLITLHQCELAKLQNIKKALLEKMFI